MQRGERVLQNINLCAYGDVARQMLNQKEGDYLIIDGTLRNYEYENGKHFFKIIVSSFVKKEFDNEYRTTRKN